MAGGWGRSHWAEEAATWGGGVLRFPLSNTSPGSPNPCRHCGDLLRLLEIRAMPTQRDTNTRGRGVLPNRSGGLALNCSAYLAPSLLLSSSCLERSSESSVFVMSLGWATVQPAISRKMMRMG